MALAPLCRGTGPLVIVGLTANTKWRILSLVEACKNCFVRFEGEEVDCFQYLEHLNDFEKPDPAYEALCNFFGV